MKKIYAALAVFMLFFGLVAGVAAQDGPRTVSEDRLLQVEMSPENWPETRANKMLPEYFYGAIHLTEDFFIVMAIQAAQLQGFQLKSREELNELKRRLWERNPAWVSVTQESGERRIIAISEALVLTQNPGFFLPAMDFTPAKVAVASTPQQDEKVVADYQRQLVEMKAEQEALRERMDKAATPQELQTFNENFRNMETLIGDLETKLAAAEESAKAAAFSAAVALVSEGKAAGSANAAALSAAVTLVSEGKAAQSAISAADSEKKASDAAALVTDAATGLEAVKSEVSWMRLLLIVTSAYLTFVGICTGILFVKTRQNGRRIKVVEVEQDTQYKVAEDLSEVVKKVKVDIDSKTDLSKLKNGQRCHLTIKVLGRRFEVEIVGTKDPLMVMIPRGVDDQTTPARVDRLHRTFREAYNSNRLSIEKLPLEAATEPVSAEGWPKPLPPVVEDKDTWGKSKA